MEDLFIKIPNDFYNNKNITNEELVIYSLLQKTYNEAKELSICSVNMLKEYMYITNRNSNDTIKNSIKTLLEKQYIKNIYNLHLKEINIDDIKCSNTFYIEIEPIHDEFFIMYENDLEKIFKYTKDKNIGKFSLVRYYIAICRVRNNQSEFGYLSQSNAKFICNRTETITKYNTVLQDELNLIIYNNEYVTPERRNSTTYFGFWDNKKNFVHQMNIVISEHNLIKGNKQKANKMRSLTQKKNKSTDAEKIKQLEYELEKLKNKNQISNTIKENHFKKKDRLKEGLEIKEENIEETIEVAPQEIIEEKYMENDYDWFEEVEKSTEPPVKVDRWYQNINKNRKIEEIF